MKTPLITFCALLLCTSSSQGEELPAVGTLAAQTASTFNNHVRDIASLSESAKEPQEIATVNQLHFTAEFSSALVVSVLTVIYMYCQVNPHERAQALEDMKRYLLFANVYIDKQISNCTWAASNSRRPAVVSEAERLRKDLRTIKDYLRAFQRIRPTDILPKSPEGLQKPIF